MKKRDGLPKGVMRREATRKLVCDMRFTHCNVNWKFHATQIESLEEGAFFHDIAKLYEKTVGCGSSSVLRRRCVNLELNYPQYSPFLSLSDLPKGFHVKQNKEQTQKLILEQARRAAKVLIQRQKCSRHVVDDSQSTLNDQTSPHQDVQCISLQVAQDHLGFAGINEALDIISLPNPKPEKFYECAAHIKQAIRRDRELFWSLENFEQAYKPEGSRCWELLKRLQDHNLRSIAESLIGNHESEREVEVLHMIRRTSELLVESPKDVLQNPWVPLFFSPDSNGGESHVCLALVSHVQHTARHSHTMHSSIHSIAIIFSRKENHIIAHETSHHRSSRKYQHPRDLITMPPKHDIFQVTALRTVPGYTYCCIVKYACLHTHGFNRHVCAVHSHSRDMNIFNILFCYL